MKILSITYIININAPLIEIFHIISHYKILWKCLSRKDTFKFFLHHILAANWLQVYYLPSKKQRCIFSFFLFSMHSANCFQQRRYLSVVIRPDWKSGKCRRHNHIASLHSSLASQIYYLPPHLSRHFLIPYISQYSTEEPKACTALPSFCTLDPYKTRAQSVVREFSLVRT